MRDSLRLPLSYSDQELNGILSQSDTAVGKPGLRLGRILNNIITNSLKQNRPVYFASTVGAGVTADWREHLVREGMSTRVVRTKTGDSIDVQRTLENAGTWRMATAGRKVEWPACMSPILRQTSWLNLYYISAYLDLARRFQSQGDLSKVDDWCRRSYALIEHLEDPQRAAQIVKAWLSLNPNSERRRN